MEDHYLLQPLITTTFDNQPITAVSSTPHILLRLISIMFIAILSIWANYEASKGFEITIMNEAGNTPAGHRFDLFFVSNDKATRIILSTSQLAEKIIYPDHDYGNPKKQVDRVTLRLASRNLTHTVVVDSDKQHEFVVRVSHSVMKEPNVERAMTAAVQRAMARVWLWDNGNSGAPTSSLVDGMVEYITISAGFSHLSDSGEFLRSPESYTRCWDDKDPMAVAHFLNYCERQIDGVVGRLNRAMQDQCWNEGTVDDAFGLPVQQLCSSYYASMVIRSSDRLDTSTTSVSPMTEL